MTTQAVDALRKLHEQVEQLIGRIGADDWVKPSLCEDWRVQDVFAHMTSNMKETVDPTPPPAEGAPDLKAEEAMEALVTPRRDWTADQLLAEYAQYYEGWLGAMAAMQEEPTASTEAPLADLGTHALHMVANAFAFDHYCHLYIDLLAPQGPLEIDVPEPTDDMVRPGIEWMLAGMPQMQPEELAAAVTGPIRLELTGAGGGQWILTPADGSGVIGVTEGSGDAAATISSSAHDYVSWGTKRSDWRDACTITGDEALATAFLDTVNII